VKVGSSIEASGFFFKRYGYLNNEPGDKVSLVSLLFIRRPCHIDDINEFAVDAESKLKLPRSGDDFQVDVKFRLQVGLAKGADDKYYGVVDGKEYSLVEDHDKTTLVEFLTAFIKEAEKAGFKPNEYGDYYIPIQLRINADTPMRAAERLIITMTQMDLVNVQYAVGYRIETPVPPPQASFGTVKN
jgi:hypothetical protein